MIQRKRKTKQMINKKKSQKRLLVLIQSGPLSLFPSLFLPLPFIYLSEIATNTFFSNWIHE
jgi:hypothetical protein